MHLLCVHIHANVEPSTDCPLVLQEPATNVSYFASTAHRKIRYYRMFEDALDANGHGSHCAGSVVGYPQDGVLRCTVPAPQGVGSQASQYHTGRQWAQLPHEHVTPCQCTGPHGVFLPAPAASWAALTMLRSACEVSGLGQACPAPPQSPFRT